jgi:hypothetical protein
MNFTTADKLKAVRREIAMRKNVYRKKVHDERMTQEEADHEISVMQAIEWDYAHVATAVLNGEHVLIIRTPPQDQTSIARRK